MGVLLYPHFQIPDFRGYFLRALDMGAGIDSGRSLATVQQDAYLNHSHTASSSATSTVSDPGHAHSINDPGHRHTHDGRAGCSINSRDNYNWWGNAYANAGATGPLYTDTQATGISINGNSTGVSVSTSVSTSVNTSTTGSSETRPKNMALLACIKY